jgi:hypothetical protein
LLVKRMKVLTTEGVVWVDITDNLDAGDIGSHWHAIHAYLRTGETSGLRQLQGAGVGLYWFETDPEEIDFWAAAGLLDFRDLVEGEHGC